MTKFVYAGQKRDSSAQRFRDHANIIGRSAAGTKISIADGTIKATAKGEAETVVGHLIKFEGLGLTVAWRSTDTTGIAFGPATLVTLADMLRDLEESLSK